jgi:hypothetical protein
MTFRVMGRRRENPATNFLEDDAVEDRFAQIVLKNSIFRIDHNSEDRWRPR